MVLPGVQALFGFQLVAVFNDPFFERLAFREQVAHLGALVFTAVAAALLMAPAAYHRVVEPRAISEDLASFATAVLAAAMVPLMLGLAIDVYVVASMIVGVGRLSVGLGASVLLGCAGLWILGPAVRRLRG